MPFVEVYLGGKHDFVARDIVFYRAAQILFAGARRITVCGIEKVNAQIERVFYNFFALFGIQSPRVHLAGGVAEAHTSEAEL